MPISLYVPPPQAAEAAIDMEIVTQLSMEGLRKLNQGRNTAWDKYPPPLSFLCRMHNTRN